MKGIIALFLGFIFMMPVFLIIINAFKPNRDILTNFIALPHGFYLDNFKEALEAMNFWNSFGNTLVITVPSVAIAILISFLAAFGISHLKGKLSNIFYFIFVMGQIIPFYAIMIPISVLSTKAHFNNSYFGLIILYSGFYTAFGVMTYVGFLKSVPKELEEAAALDGCGLFRTMIQIVSPLIIPTTITLTVLFFLWTWNDYLLPSILIGNENMRTITVNLYLFKGTTNAKWNLFIAGLTVSIIPIVIIYILSQKYITNGLTSGSIK